MAQVFNASSEEAGPQLVVLEKALVTEAEQLTVKAKKAISSLQAEQYPAKKPLPTAEDTVAKLLQSVASCASVETREAAEKALSATTQAMATLEVAGTLPTDTDMVALAKRKERQAKEVARLKDKAPTMCLRKLALVEERTLTKSRSKRNWTLQTEDA